MVRRLLTGVFQTVVRYTVAVIFLGLLWQVGTTAFGDAVLPSPWATGKLFLTSLTEPVYLTHLGISTLRLAVGMTIAAAAAFLLGLWLGHVRLADKLGAPLIFITYPLPKIVLLPVFFLLLGLGESSRILLIALTTGYQMLVIVRAAAKALDPVYEDAVRFMGGNLGAVVRHVYIPAALPDFFTSLKVASGTGVAVLFLAESFATNTGLGYLIMDAWGLGDTLSMFNGILGMGALGLALYASVWGAEQLCCPWRRGA